MRPFDIDIVKRQIEDTKTGLGAPIDVLFKRFDETPPAAAGIAQVHTARLPDDREVVVKVVRPNIREQIIADFELLRQIGHWVAVRVEAARAIHLTEIIEDYRQIMLNELNLSYEAQNSQKMRHNFLDSSLIYVRSLYSASIGDGI